MKATLKIDGIEVTLQGTPDEVYWCIALHRLNKGDTIPKIYNKKNLCSVFYDAERHLKDDEKPTINVFDRTGQEIKTHKKKAGRPLGWTKKQDQYLIDNYHKIKTKKIAKKLGKIPKVVRNRAYILGVTSRWSESDIAYLIENHNKKSVPQLAKHLNKSDYLIRTKKIELSLGVPEKVKETFEKLVFGTEQVKHWSKEEKDFIIEHYNRMMTREIATKLHRTQRAVQMHASILGVTNDPRGKAKKNKTTLFLNWLKDNHILKFEIKDFTTAYPYIKREVALAIAEQQVRQNKLFQDGVDKFIVGGMKK